MSGSFLIPYVVPSFAVLVIAIYRVANRLYVKSLVDQSSALREIVQDIEERYGRGFGDNIRSYIRIILDDWAGRLSFLVSILSAAVSIIVVLSGNRDYWPMGIIIAVIFGLSLALGTVFSKEELGVPVIKRIYVWPGLKPTQSDLRDFVLIAANLLLILATFLAER